MNADRPQKPRILIAGIGNIFLGDDAFGSEVARRLMARPLPDGAEVIDFGIRGLDLSYALTDGYEAAILIDACPRGQGAAGTLYVIEPAVESSAGSPPMLDGHSMDPVKVLRIAAAMGSNTRVLLVGCEPTPSSRDAEDDGSHGGEDDMQLDMSLAVRNAVDEAVLLVESVARSLLESLLHGCPMNQSWAAALPQSPSAAAGSGPLFTEN